MYKCPIFEIEKNVHFQALVACAIGNDCWEGSQYKYGVVAALGVVKSAQKKKNVSSCYKFYTDAIIGFATNRGGIKCRKSIADFANAFLYEPANKIREDKIYLYDIKNICLTISEVMPQMIIQCLCEIKKKVPVLVYVHSLEKRHMDF